MTILGNNLKNMELFVNDYGSVCGVEVFDEMRLRTCYELKNQFLGVFLLLFFSLSLWG